ANAIGVDVFALHDWQAYRPPAPEPFGPGALMGRRDQAVGLWSPVILVVIGIWLLVTRGRTAKS
ncbi:MAG TPA: hypothetical protein VFO75_04250, partial [Candidatus Dormibacteraeota bacterium]|nr:hypothetical protein [Candidatus Dormibacteraeota bacterium]